MNELLFREGFMGTVDVMIKGGHCVANCGVGNDWLTVYLIKTEKGYRNKGEATKLLEAIKEKFSNTKKIMLWCPMNEKIEQICKRLEIQTV